MKFIFLIHNFYLYKTENSILLLSLKDVLFIICPII